MLGRLWLYVIPVDTTMFHAIIDIESTPPKVTQDNL